MKRTNISFFIPHIGCPHRCSFCDQRSISGESAAPDREHIKRVLDEQSEHLADKGITAEIAFFGGSFTAIPHRYMEELLSEAHSAMVKYPEVYTGIRCSTRPDYINEEILDTLVSYGMKTVELGAQSMSDEVLKANERGHTAEDVRKSSELIKSKGLSLGLQMMTGLYKDSEDAVMHTMKEFIKLRPECVRVYPTVVLKGTKLGELYEKGLYKTFSFEDTVRICAVLLKNFEENGIKVIRMGLHASRDVEERRLAGVYHPAFREICESEIIFEEMKKELLKKEKGTYAVYTDKKNLSKVLGQRKSNVKKMKDLGYGILVYVREKKLAGAFEIEG